MIDLKKLKDNPKAYEDSAKLRGHSIDTKKLIAQDDERLKLLAEVEELRSKLKLKAKPDAAALKELQATKATLERSEAKLDKLTEELDTAARDIPNLMAPDTPAGGEESNVEEKTWGKKASKVDIKDHLTFAEEHDLVDFERGAKTSGNKFYFSKGALVKLELAVLKMATDMLEQKGFTLMGVPHLVNERVADGTGFLPRGEERQLYKIEDENLYLIATAEMPLTGYHADEIIDPVKLPLLYAGISPAYRMEAGAYGKHSKGLYRVHQFNKLELYVYCAPEDSDQWLQRLVEIEEEITQALEIPYRRTRTAAGDMGAPHYQKYDLEYWSPVDGEYRELTSASNCTDYQARRLNIRTRGLDGKTRYAHTLNATAVAFSRVPVALIENHQTGDGVAIPAALRPYYGGSIL